jgi:nucleoside-diphosphate-sugar epimerase
VEVFRDFCVDVEGGWGRREVKVRYIAGTENDPQKRKPNIEKAEEWLGFHPRVDLVEGLRRTFAFYF